MSSIQTITALSSNIARVVLFVLVVFIIECMCSCVVCCSVFDRAIQNCGLDFRSVKIWELYIAWESGQGRQRHVTAVYDKLLALPTKDLLIHFERLATLFLPPTPPSFTPTLLPLPPSFPYSFLYSPFLLLHLPSILQF